MFFTDIEKKYGFSYPESFHRIRLTGAMEWAECGADEFMCRRQEYFSDPRAFMMIDADCELITPDGFERQTQLLDECNSQNEEYLGMTFNPRYRFVPFGFSGGGDIFCFVYGGQAEPFIAKIYHDDAEHTQLPYSPGKARNDRCFLPTNS